MRRFNPIPHFQQVIKVRLFEQTRNLHQVFSLNTFPQQGRYQLQATLHCLDVCWKTYASVFLKAIEEYEPATACEIRRQHQACIHLQADVKAWMEACDYPENSSARYQLTEQLLCSVERLVLKICDCFSAESTILPSILWRYYTDAVLYQFCSEALSNLPRHLLWQYIKHFIQCNDREQVKTWMQDIWPLLHPRQGKVLEQLIYRTKNKRAALQQHSCQSNSDTIRS